MERELIIRSNKDGIDIALLEDKKLVELHQDTQGSQFNVSDIYLGRVKRLNPGLNAAFVDVGYNKDAFLHYTDLGPNVKTLVNFTNHAITGKDVKLESYNFAPQIVKTGKINNAIAKRNPLLVQILKEPISTKGPRLTSEITLSGRYLVLVPLGGSVGISRKISKSEERNRLVHLIESIRPKNFGVVIRTAAEGKTVAELHDDLNNLVKKWEGVITNLQKKEPPVKLLSEMSRTTSLLRDLLNESFSKIITNDKKMEAEIREYVRKIAPEKERIVHFYSSKSPFFDDFGVTRQIKGLFGKTVTMDSGAYLVIEHTEALHVVDVNSGQRVNNDVNQEENALQVNIESAKEIARQLRLRDVGGIIIIDFIDIRNPEGKKEILKVMRDAMKADRARHTILPISRFGLMQITRQRVRPELNISTTEVCPSCNGSGKIEASVLIVDEIERNIEYLAKNHPSTGIKLHVHPFVYAYLKQGYFNKWKALNRKHKQKMKLVQNIDIPFMEFSFYDKNDEEIVMS